MPAADAGAPLISPEPDWRDTVRITHCAVRGRARLHVKGLRHSADLKNRLVQRLSRWSDIRAAWPNIDTGNLLVLFDAALPAQIIAERVALAARSHADDAAGDVAWHRLDPRDVVAELRTSLEHGPRSDVAADRLSLSGPNSVPAPTRPCRPGNAGRAISVTADAAAASCRHRIGADWRRG